MIRRPPRSTLDRSSAASDVYKRQVSARDAVKPIVQTYKTGETIVPAGEVITPADMEALSLIHISEPTRPY